MTGSQDDARAILTQIHLTDVRAEQYKTLGTEAMLAATAGDWIEAAAVIDREECLELMGARTSAERHGIRQFYEWVRQAHVNRQ